MEYLYHLMPPGDDSEPDPPEVSHEHEMQALTTLLMVKECSYRDDSCDVKEPHLADWLGFLTCGHRLALCDFKAMQLAKLFLDSDDHERLCPACFTPGVYFTRLRAV